MRGKAIRPRVAEADASPDAEGASDFPPLPNERGGYVAADGNGRGPMILAAALAVLAVFGAVVWNAYSKGVRPAGEEAAPVLADDGAFKRKPTSAEADASRSALNARVFDRVDGGKAGPADKSASDAVHADAPTAPAATPAPEKAEAPAAKAPAADLPAPTAKLAAEAGPSATSVAHAAAAAPALRTSKTESAAKAAAPAAPKPAVMKAASAASAAQKAPVETKAEPAASDVKSPGAPAFAANGPFLAQIAAPSSMEAAVAEWNKRKLQAPDLFEGAERVIVEADVNGRKVYRVRVRAFATGDAASAYCRALVARGGPCYRVPR